MTIVLYTRCPLCSSNALKTLDGDTVVYQLCLNCRWEGRAL